MGRTEREIDAEAVTPIVLRLIAEHRGKPCPTRAEIKAWTGLPQRRVWRFLRELERRGLIEMEERRVGPGHLRRLRLAGGRWTGWTARKLRTPKRRRGGKR